MSTGLKAFKGCPVPSSKPLSSLPHYSLVETLGGHEVIHTNPKGLAEKIIEAGRD